MAAMIVTLLFFIWDCIPVIGEHHKEFMSDIQTQFVKNILSGAQNNAKPSGFAFAPSNIALSKYWGKRDADLNLPINSSLSVSLGSLGTRTEIKRADRDAVYLNGTKVDAHDSFAIRTLEFLRLFPILGKAGIEVRTENNIPTAAGLASSASGFAALVMALDDLAGWGLDKKRLSMLARLGSGSASRSVFEGFVQWNAGENPDGTDSYAEPLSKDWNNFRIGILEISKARKPVGSRDGMNRTVQTSELYKSWPVQANRDIETIRSAIEAQDFPTLGKTAENNALAMHATMMSAWPPLIYLQPESIEMIHKVQRVRADGLEVYLTIDAGPNIKLLFLEKNAAAVAEAFPALTIIKPFG
jgi:diphosphomevalonate decarboxylase